MEARYSPMAGMCRRLVFRAARSCRRWQSGCWGGRDRGPVGNYAARRECAHAWSGSETGCRLSALNC